MVLGSSEKLKCEYATELVAALMHLMIISNDRVGLILYNDGVREFIPPKGGINQLYYLVDVLSNPKIYTGSSRIENALDFALDNFGESITSVVLVSDFISMKSQVEDNLFLLTNRFETMAIMVKDMLDKTLPNINKEIVIEDPATKQQLLVNPKVARKIYEKNALYKEQTIKDIFRRGNVDVLSLETDKPFFFDLASFLKMRVDKKGGVF